MLELTWVVHYCYSGVIHPEMHWHSLANSDMPNCTEIYSAVLELFTCGRTDRQRDIASKFSLQSRQKQSTSGSFAFPEASFYCLQSNGLFKWIRNRLIKRPLNCFHKPLYNEVRRQPGRTAATAHLQWPLQTAGNSMMTLIIKYGITSSYTINQFITYVLRCCRLCYYESCIVNTEAMNIITGTSITKLTGTAFITRDRYRSHLKFTAN